MKKVLSQYPALNILSQFFIILFSALCFAVSLNMFLIPGDIYSGGVTGISQLITYSLKQFTPFGNIIQTGTLNFLLNIPLLILSYMKLGRRFTILTVVVVAIMTGFTLIIPVQQVSANPLLNGIVAGALNGLGGGLTIKFGMSAGGIDIIALVINRLVQINVGSLSLLINSVVIVGAGILYSWEFALYTLISMYVTSRVVNSIHTNEQRLTAFIVTDKEDEVVKSIYDRIHRGITILDGRGGYSKKTRNTLMIVINRYELYDLEMAIGEADIHAFVNIIQSTRVNGNYLNRDQQNKLKQNKT
ncbi:YitT family protein [Aerococcaceae bacterium INB8]|uniref:YitT family protein n=1 Tax=Ruoffia halotolerans TaxID=2748684 RepID=A0A839A7H9_9LACT|nr:YitT family protein [Ruoffia halotolerans]